MKLNKILLLSLTLMIISCGDDEVDIKCLPQNLQNGVIAIYPFENGNLKDYSGESHDLTNTSNASTSTDRNGNTNCAYVFDNRIVKDEFLSSTGTDFLNNLEVFSVSVWYEPHDTTNTGSLHSVLVGRGTEGRCPDRGGEWSVGIYDCKRAVFGHDNSVWADPVTNFSAGCQGEVNALSYRWHHVVAIKNKDTYKIYFNGALQEIVSGDANCGSTSKPATDVGDLIIGAGYTGKIDDIIIYDRELAQSEVTTLYNLEPCCD